MSGARNDIFDALLTIGRSILPAGPGSSWGDTGRKMKAPEQAQLPALFQVEGDSDYESKLGQLARRHAKTHWVLIHNAGADQAIEPSRYSQDWIDAVEAALGNGVNINTLGGRVFAAYIDGTIKRSFGDLDGIEMVIIPITILLP